ncbi:MAG: hypothetical protein M1833_001770 [Piccolia ochrophora]|nr:MAG: hypothetical protein M1833_001770 [Piccolia ochrophora]
MDYYGTAKTVIQDVYNVYVFISGVVEDVKMYDQDRKEIQVELNFQLIFVNSFRKLFFDEAEGALLMPGHLPLESAQIIVDVLERLKSSLSAYEALALKHGVMQTSDAEHESSLQPALAKSTSFGDRIKAKTKGVSKKIGWSLMDKEKLLATLSACTKWTEKIRHLTQFFLQVSGPVEAQLSRTKLGESDTLHGLGLHNVVKRQSIAGKNPPAEFMELNGQIIQEASSGGIRTGTWQLGDVSKEMVVEYRQYDSAMRRDDLEPDELADLKAPMRTLAWLLHNAEFPEGEGSSRQSSDQPAIYSLRCLGYMDQPANERTVFLFHFPPKDQSSGADSSSIATLHGLINAVKPGTSKAIRKPSLGDRFLLAHTLSLTVANIHGSGWVHKNIWSRGILCFPTTTPGTSSSSTTITGTQPHLLPYLTDWGFARPTTAGTDLRADFEVEPNLYRHPDRQGKPTYQFTKQHDMYALGVVLLEIGLWTTVSKIFAKDIHDHEKSGSLPKGREVRKGLVSLAETELTKQMGTAYAGAVVACLKGQFGVKNDDMNQTSLSIAFTEKVVETVVAGVKL